MVKKKDIIMIIDLKSVNSNQQSQQLLKNLEKKKRIYLLAPKEEGKSLIITNNAYYYSPISSITLLKRSRKQKEWTHCLSSAGA